MLHFTAENNVVEIGRFINRLGKKSTMEFVVYICTRWRQAEIKKSLDTTTVVHKPRSLPVKVTCYKNSLPQLNSKN